MRYHNNGAFFGVTVLKAEVESYKQMFPCSGLPNRAVWFQFAAASGDLIDLRPFGIDGPGVSALCDDARDFGLARHKGA